MVKLISQSDEELVYRAQEGEMEAFSMLYERYLPTVYRRVRYVIPENDIEDVTQEVFIAVMKSLRGFRGDSRFGTWLRTLVNRQVADYYRRRNPSNHLVESLLDGEEPNLNPIFLVEANTGFTDDCIVVRQALNRIPEKYKEILLLRFADDLPFQDIAGRQGDSLEATKSLFRRAIAALQKEVGILHGQE